MSEKSVQDVAREILNKLRASRSVWGQGSFAKDAGGEPGPIHSPAAVCFCAVGLIKRATLGRPPGLERKTVEAVFLHCGEKLSPVDCDDGEYMAVYRWNDAPERTVDDVIAVFEKVAA